MFYLEASLGMSRDRPKSDSEITSTGIIHDALSVERQLVDDKIDQASKALTNSSDISTKINSGEANTQQTTSTPLDSIDIPVALLHNGSVNFSIYQTQTLSQVSTPETVKVEITYKPDQDTVESGPLYLSYRDDKGFGNVIEMQPDNFGNWKSTREMFPSESSELGIHRVDPRKMNGPPDFDSPDHFQTQIPLVDCHFVREVFPNPSLAAEGRIGTLQRRIYRTDNTISEPLAEDEHPPLAAGEEIIHIYLPHQYSHAETTEKKFPLILMLDGDMHVGIDSYGNKLNTPSILDNLVAEGKMEPSIVIFTAPTSPTAQGTPRLREYGCSAETASRLASLPHAAANAGLSVGDDGACLCGASMAGIQAIYTAVMHPNVFSRVLAQSPALWWEPPLTLSGDKHHVEYDRAETWRKDPAEKFHINYDALTPAQKTIMDESRYEGFIHHLLSMRKDSRTGESIPEGKIDIHLQVGRNETGTIHPVVGKEPLTQATKTLAKDFNMPLTILDGPHSPNIWASGLCLELPEISPRLEVNQKSIYSK